MDRNETSVQPLRTGYLYKQGGGYRNWKRRYFVLQDSVLSYYVKEGDDTPKRSIDLTTGRGVRSKEQCVSVEVWPKDAGDDTTFGLATDTRTFYMYGKRKEDVREWKNLLQQTIEKVGRPTQSYEQDPEGKPEGLPSKLAKQGAKVVTTLSKVAIRMAVATGKVDESAVKLVDGIADAVDGQVDAGRDATITGRVKMMAEDSAKLVSENVDNPDVSAAAEVLQEQIKADSNSDDTNGSVTEDVAEVTGEGDTPTGVSAEVQEVQQGLSVPARDSGEGVATLPSKSLIVADVTGIEQSVGAEVWLVTGTP